MRQTSKKRSNIILVIVLGCAVIVGVLLGAYINHKAIPCRRLDKPDGITVNYMEDGVAKSKQLSRKEINFLFDAFNDMLENSVPGGHASVALSPSSIVEEPAYSGEIFEHGANIEFHYNRPRFVEVLIVPSELSFIDKWIQNDSGCPCSVFCGEVDSLAIVCENRQSKVQFWGCLDGEYYSSYISAVSCSLTETDKFLSAVNSCIE